MIIGGILFVNSSFFALTGFEIISENIVPTEEYIPYEYLQGRNIFHIRLGNLEETALRHRQIKSVTIKRRLPGTLLYEVEERRPLALIKGPNSRFCVDYQGYVLKEYEEVSAIYLPLIDIALDELYGDTESINDPSIQRILSLLKDFDDVLLKELERIVLEENTIIVQVQDGGQIFLGQAYTSWELNQIIRHFWGEMGNDWQNLDYLDLRYQDRPVYRLQEK